MIGRRGMQGRLSFWIGPVAVSPLRMWGWRFWFGPQMTFNESAAGKVLYLPWLRVQFGGVQPWRRR